MYSVNLYPEQVERKRAARTAAFRFTILAALLGTEVFLVGTIGFGGIVVGPEIGSLRSQVDHMKATTNAAASQPPTVEIADEIMGVRAQRIDWAPKLAALSRDIPPGVVLTNFIGQMDEHRRLRCELVGSVTGAVGGSAGGGGSIGGATEMETISGFIESLKKDPSFSQDLPQIRVGTIEGEEVHQIHVICEPRQQPIVNPQGSTAS